MILAVFVICFLYVRYNTVPKLMVNLFLFVCFCCRPFSGFLFIFLEGVCLMGVVWRWRASPCPCVTVVTYRRRIACASPISVQSEEPSLFFPHCNVNGCREALLKLSVFLRVYHNTNQTACNKSFIVNSCFHLLVKRREGRELLCAPAPWTVRSKQWSTNLTKAQEKVITVSC